MDSSKDNIATETEPGTASKSWRPLTRIQRRVIGVLIEKSKTTPDVYPMSINGIKTGSNQKSNRSPKLDLNEHEVEETLYELRHMGAVIEVHSGGRVPKYKHEMYDWLGVNKAELAVMTELLLRGEQSIGDLRSRAARMEKSIGGLEDLRPILASLKDKNLLVELSPAGRGQIVTHNLYRDEELVRLQTQFESMESNEESDEDADDEAVDGFSAPRSQSAVRQQPGNDDRLERLQERVEELESTVATLREELAELKSLIES